MGRVLVEECFFNWKTATYRQILVPRLSCPTSEPGNQAAYIQSIVCTYYRVHTCKEWSAEYKYKEINVSMSTLCITITHPHS